MSTKKLILGALLSLALVVGLGLYFRSSAEAQCGSCPLPGGWTDSGPCNKPNGRAFQSSVVRCSADCYYCGDGNCRCIVVTCLGNGPNPGGCQGVGPDSFTDYCQSCEYRYCPCDLA